MAEHRNPVPTVDIIIELERPGLPGGTGIVLIKRKNPPHGWALPGGFVDYGEPVEAAAIREAREETCLEVELVQQLHVYSDPARDTRLHTLSVVFLATASGTPQAADDAKEIGIFTRDTLPEPLCFDHAQILDDYFTRRYH